MHHIEKINRQTGSRQDVFEPENLSFNLNISILFVVDALFWLTICMVQACKSMLILPSWQCFGSKKALKAGPWCRCLLVIYWLSVLYEKCLILAVFATIGLLVGEYAKYDALCCQENSYIISLMLLISSTSMPLLFYGNGFTRRHTDVPCKSGCNQHPTQLSQQRNGTERHGRTVNIRDNPLQKNITCHSFWFFRWVRC